MSTTIRIDTPQPPPYWALLERELIAAQNAAIPEFHSRYFDERGYLLCVPRWGGNDGPDDAAENFLNWTTLHALGGDDAVLALYKHAWEGHLRQYTEARTVQVPLGRDGMYFKEFATCFDWFHHGEGFSAFFLQGLSDPEDGELQRRSRRYAAMYMDQDPLARNYDPERRLIRSMFNGSRGPLLRRATPLDWAGDPIEIEGRFKPLHAERTFAEMLEHFEDYGEVVGDHPLNLAATTLGFNAFALTGEAAYREHVLGYVDAWRERTSQNDGIIPSHICLDGRIPRNGDGGCGGRCSGQWYGGCYGWAFTIRQIPFTGVMAHRPAVYSRAHYGFGSAYLLTGDRGYLEPWRSTLERVNAAVLEGQGGKTYPRMFGADGWYDFRAEKFAPGALEMYYWTLDRSYLDLLPSRPRWVRYLDGEDDGYAVDALSSALVTVRERVEMMRADMSTPDTRLSDDTNETNPATTDALVELTLGGLPVGRLGFPLHCQVRYFDPEHRRAGLPADVAALVERITETGVTLSLANVSQVCPRTVTVQAGGYGEHHIESLTFGDTTTPVGARAVTIHMGPGTGARVELKLRRYTNPPTFAFPWS